MSGQKNLWIAVLLPVVIVLTSFTALFIRDISVIALLNGDYGSRASFQLMAGISGLTYWVIKFTIPAVRTLAKECRSSH